MAINIPIITSLEDKGIRAAKAAFANFQTSVGEAQGGLNKFKAGSKSVMDSVAANAGTFAIAGGIAFAKFATDGVKAFQELALGAEKFATSTGLSIQDASRYIEAAGDIAVPVDAVEAAIGRLNKTIGADPDKVRKLGVDLVYLRDGSLDVNETFKNTIDRIKGIKDPAEKARVAAQLLGKGWQTMAELIEGGADNLSASLKEVSDQKVISEAELQMAREYRAAMDGLGDSVDDLQIKSGQRLIPMVTFLTNGATAALDLDDKVTELFKDIVGNGTQAEETLSDLAGIINDNRINAGSFKTAIQQARNPLNELATAATKVSEAFLSADSAWKVLTDSLDQNVALDDAYNALAALETAKIEAFKTGELDTFNSKAKDFYDLLAKIAGGMDTISSKQIYLRLKTDGDLAALQLAGYLARGAEYGGLSAVDALNLAGISTLPARAMGGPVMGGGGPYLVGERGPELFTPASSGNISANGSGGGNTVTINVNGGDPMQVVQALQTYVRTIGPVPVNTRTM